MPQVTVNSDMPRRNANTNDDSLSIVDIQELIKREKREAEEELVREDDLTILNQDNTEENSEESDSETKKSNFGKRLRAQKLSKGVKKKIKKPMLSTEAELTDELLAEIIKKEFMDSESHPAHSAGAQTVYTCKFCKKDFSSSFILCLHVQIHEKVNSTGQKSSLIDSLAASDNIAIIKKKSGGNFNVSGGSSSAGNISKVDSGSSGSKSDIKLETEEGCLPPAVKTEPPVSLKKNNFVENLKKNLSLAMNRNS